MKLLAKAPRGTKDILPATIGKWNTVQQIVLEKAKQFGFAEIRTPMFESTKLFVRSVGDTTDVAQKEMYTFSTKEDGESFSLRPEGTAGIARAVLENGLLNGPLPLKLSYFISCFRHEKPQAGRLREFHQFGVETLGSKEPSADAEVIALASGIFEELGVVDLSLEINSIGCPHCRAKYHEALKSYFENKKDRLCDVCLERLVTNPMRLLDCKAESCREIAKEAPVILDYLCEECASHFSQVKKYLKALDISYVVNPRIVRGLDYYTKTVFEFVSQSIGAQGTVCGGGRYDGLLEMLGGKPAPGLGFAMGIERLLLVLEKQGSTLYKEQPCHVYVGSMGEAGNIKAMALANSLRKASLSVQCDTMGRSVKAQMKYADKIQALYSCIIGDNEVQEGQVQLKNMLSGDSKKVSFEEIVQAIEKMEALAEDMVDNRDNNELNSEEAKKAGKGENTWQK